MLKILAFEKIITQISSLKNEFLQLDKLIIYAESLDQILQNKIQKLAKNENQNNIKQEKLEQNNSDENLENLEIFLEQILENNLESELKNKLEIRQKEQNNEQNLANLLKLFLSSHDFLALELSHFWLQNQYTLGTNPLSKEKKIRTKWQNLLETLEKLIAELQKLEEKQILIETKTRKFELENNFEQKNEICEQNWDSKLDLKNLLIDKIIQIGQKITKIIQQNSTLKPTFLYKKNLLDVSFAKNNWNLQSHFDELIEKIRQKQKNNSDKNNKTDNSNNNLVIQTNLEKDDFEELLKICGLNYGVKFSSEFSSDLKLVYASPSKQIAKIGKKLFVKNQDNLLNSQNKNLIIKQNFEENCKDNVEDNFISSFNLEIFLDQKLKEINLEKGLEKREIKKEKEELEQKNQKSTLENLENLEIEPTNLLTESTQNQNSNQIIIQTANQKVQNNIQNSSQKIIVLVCGQNSTFKDCSQIVVSPKFAKKFLILGESGSLTKMASKIDTFKGFLIVKMSDLLHLLEISNLNCKTCEIWVIGQPYFRLDDFWKPTDQAKLKELQLQSQLNFLEKTCNCTIYFVKSYWK